MGHKHKKESKKKKRRSRSDSPECVEIDKVETKRHHKKHHKDRHKEKHLKRRKEEEIIISDDDDLVEVPPPPKISRYSPEVLAPPPPPKEKLPPPSKERPPPSLKERPPAPPKERLPPRERAAPKERPLTPPPPTIKSSSDSSLSIEETNRLRAKLGLAPLDTPSNDTKKDDEKPKIVMGGTDMGDFVHKPAENIFQKAETEKIKAKIAERKMKREMDAKLARVKRLADSDSDDDVSSWVEKSRKLAIAKKIAEKKAKELEEMDAAFGVSDLINDDIKLTRKDAYSAKDLKGLKVEHDVTNFVDGKNVVLTLKDKGVLDEEDDALINVNLVDEERYQKNLFNKKQKPHTFGYNAYEDDDEEEDVEMADKVLSKYDEEIGGQKKKSFTIGNESNIEVKKMLVKEKLLAGKRLESLQTKALTLASDYLTESEMKVKFKKPKKKVRKVRKMLKADDLLAMDQSNDQSTNQEDWLTDHGARRRPHVDLKPDPDAGSSRGCRNIRIKDEPLDMELDTDDLPPITEDFTNVVVDVPDDFELELALKKARKLKQMENVEVKPEEQVIKMAEQLDHKMAYEESGPGGSIVLNATAEFCRTLGDIPTYGQAGNREEDEQQMQELEQELKEEKERLKEERNLRGGWNEVDTTNEPVTTVTPVEAPILDAEPDLGTGIAGAVKLAMSKGYLEREVSKRPSASRFAHLQAQNYSIEDKAMNKEDDKFSRRERFNGPTTDFKEKDGYKPNIKLDYIDDDGHKLSAKEAFRYLSHKFHGKGPSKNKVEKRMKKVEQESLMKQMSSTDTPLGTLNMLQAKQKETQSPFVVLSGNKQLQTISKTKF